MPLSLHLDSTGRICGYDPSRAEHADGTAGDGWVFVTATQYAQAQALAYPRWTGDGVIDDPPPPGPTPEQAALAEAAALLADPDCAEAVDAVLARVQAVALLGVEITDWTFQGVTAAAESAGQSAADLSARIAILQAAVALRVAWDRVVYHTQTMRDADRLWPYLVTVVTGQ